MTNNIQQLTDDSLKSIWQDPNFIIIDIREPSEFAREHIPGSKNIPASQLANTNFSADQDKKVIFTCLRGSRTRAAESAILASGIKNIYCLTGGLEQWKRCGMPTVFNKKAPIELMRQVQIATGGLVLLSAILSWIFSLKFIFLAGLAGAGLMLAGMTGCCVMAKLLQLMPWNRSL